MTKTSGGQRASIQRNTSTANQYLDLEKGTKMQPIRDRWKSTSSTTGQTSMMPDNQTNRLDNHLNNNTSESEVTSETVSEGETVREQYQQRIDKINNGN